MCGLSRFVLPSAMLGIVVATLVGSAAAGWLVAIVVGGFLYLLGRRRFQGSCAVPPRGWARRKKAGPDRVETP